MRRGAGQQLHHLDSYISAALPTPSESPLSPPAFRPPHSPLRLVFPSSFAHLQTTFPPFSLELEAMAC